MKYALERSKNCKLQEGNRKLKEGKYFPLLNMKLTKFSFNVNPVLYFPETNFFIVVFIDVFYILDPGVSTERCSSVLWGGGYAE